MSKKASAAVLAAAVIAIAVLAVAAGAFAAGSPAVTNVTATGVTNNAATLGASVNPNGQPTSVAFESGTTVHYTVQTAVQSAGSGSTPVTVTAQLTGLRPGTTYHFRALASNAGGAAASGDVTFTTAGIAPPTAAAPQTTTGATTGIAVDGATLTGTVNAAALPAGEAEQYYFQIGAQLPYTLQTLPVAFRAGSAPVAAAAQVSGLGAAQTFHYRLVAVSDSGQVSVGADQTFTTLPRERLHPTAVQVTASPAYQRAMPDRITVSGRMVPPASMSDFLACRGYFDVTFRVGQIAVQSLRAGIHSDCTFSLPVVFHERRRLMGGHVVVHVLFAGNRFLHRLEAPPVAIQVG